MTSACHAARGVPERIATPSAVLSTSELRHRLPEEPALVKQFALARSASRVLLGVGDLAPPGTVRQSERARWMAGWQD